MPFPKQTARAFTRANIENLKTGQMGVYGLYKQGQWIYIGRGDIRARLLDHFNGDNACIVRAVATHWYDVVTADHVAQEKKLILEYDPACNQKVG